MQTIVVKGSSQLQQIITQLTNYNNQFKSKVAELVSEQKRLDGMWDGEANTEFNRIFNEDKKQFDVFYDTIQDYINKLKTIKENYENTEANNKAIAGTRGKS